jgi:hypothetical protein
MLITRKSTDSALLLPFPIELPRQQGAMSLYSSGIPLSVRLHNIDYELLKTEGEWIGMKPSQLMRWFTVYGARELAYVRTGHAPVVRP